MCEENVDPVCDERLGRRLGAGCSELVTVATVYHVQCVFDMPTASMSVEKHCVAAAPMQLV